MAPSRRLPRPGTAVLSLVAVCVFAGAAPGVAAQEAPRKWLISLSPAQKKVYYTGLPMFTEATDLIKIHQAPKAKTPPAQQPALISEAPNILVSDLAEPRAIALHTAASSATPVVAPAHAGSVGIMQWFSESFASSKETLTSSSKSHKTPTSKFLFVYDGQTKQIHCYKLNIASSLTGVQTVTATKEAGTITPKGTGVVTALAADIGGNLYYATGSAIHKVTRSENAETTVDSVIYSAVLNSNMVSQASSLLADGLFLYWTNAASGGSNGSVVRARLTPSDDVLMGPVKLAVNMASASGVCVGSGNLVYTSTSAGSIFATKAGNADEAGKNLLLTNGIAKPANCAYDGEGTTFVAGDDAVFSFSSNFGAFRSVKSMQKVVGVDGVSEVQLLTSGAPGGAFSGAALLVVLVVGAIAGGIL